LNNNIVVGGNNKFFNDFNSSPVSCKHTDINKICAISKEICPGICIYADVLENVSLGIIIFDVKERKINFQNIFAQNLLRKVTRKKSFKSLFKLLVPDPSKSNRRTTSLHNGLTP